MQERRTTTRLSHCCRAQYCSSEDLLPRDGQITNLSERGVGLLVREAHRNGEMLSIGFSLPGAREPLTATGVVRWADTPRKGRWYPLGVDWLPLEEAARNRLQQFLAASPKPARDPAAPAQRRRGLAFVIAGAAVLLVAGFGALRGMWSLYAENRQLQAAVEEREHVIGQLEQEGTRLALELGTAKTHLAETASEVARLDQQTQGLGGQIERLSAEVDGVQTSYLQVREERERFMQQALELEQERASLASRLSSVEELRLAIEEAIAARREARQTERLAHLKARRVADRELTSGNRGYLIKDGRPTIGLSTVWVRVHEPQAEP